MDDCLAQLPCAIGEILVARHTDEAFSVCHRDDVARDGLDVYHSADAAAELARYDDAGSYRPLKTAPNLRHGWRLLLASRAELRLALNLFYPGRLAAYAVWRRGGLTTTSFRTTLNRQTGMYRVAAKISDAQADELIARFCRSDGGCLRTILWRRDDAGTIPSAALPAEKFDPAHDQTGRGEQAVPLLCQEICNLVVAGARQVVKAE